MFKEKLEIIKEKLGFLKEQLGNLREKLVFLFSGEGSVTVTEGPGGSES